MGFLDIFRKNKIADTNPSTGQTVYTLSDVNNYLNDIQAAQVYLNNIYNTISNDVASFKVNDTTTSDKEVNVNNDYITQALALNPNERYTQLTFWENVVKKMLIENIAVVIPDFSTRNKLSLYLINDSDWEWVDDTQQKIIYNKHVYPLSSFLIFDNTRSANTQSLTNLLKLLGSNINSQLKQLKSMGMKGLIKVNQNMVDGSMEHDVKTRLEHMISVAKETGFGYLQQNEEYEAINPSVNTITDSALQATQEALYNSFGISSAIFNGKYSDAEYRAYYNSVVSVYQKIIEQEINRKLISAQQRNQGRYISISSDLFKTSSLKDMTTFLYEMKMQGILSANEARQYLNLPSYKGGDVYETNLNSAKINEDGTATPRKDEGKDEGEHK